MTADPREEISLTLGDREFRVRPTFQIISGIEAALDTPAKTLGLRCLSAAMLASQREATNAGREISLTELAVILTFMLRGQPNAPKDANEAGELLMEHGCVGLYTRIGLFLTGSNRGHREHIREAEEQAERDRKAKEAGEQKEARQDGDAGPRTAA